MSALFVAATTMTPVLPSKPSISVNSWFNVCSLSSLPPPTPVPLDRPTASISSTKTMHGAFSFAFFNKLGTGDGKEWNTGFTGDRFGEQSLTGTRRTDQQNALRDLRADGGESFRFLQKLDNLHEILLGFVDTGNVIERDARVRLHLKLGFGFTKRHRVVAAHASRHAL